MHRPTIWMNVTTSARWQRPPVGIVRVERSLCNELEKIYKNHFKQCVWNGEDFVEVEARKELESILSSKAPTVSKQAEPQVQWLFPLVSKKEALKLFGQSFLSLMPSRIRPWVNQWLTYLKKKIHHLLIRRNGRLATLFRRGPTRRLNEQTKVTHQGGGASCGELFSSGDILISIGLDWDHSFYKSFYSLRKEKGVKVVTCCYDLIPVLYPQYCVGEVANIFTSYFLDIADGSDLILCISKQSEKDLVGLLQKTGGALPATQVFPLGDTVPRSSGENISDAVKALSGTRFILFVSSIERRKNHEVLYKAYHLLCEAGHQDNLPKLVFVGMQGWGVADLMSDIKLDPITRGMILQFNHVTDDELYSLYQSSLFCVFPSFYEGWGLPVAEALAMGKVVIASSQGSLPEVGGDLVLYVDPWSAREWADALLKMSTDDTWREVWERKIRGAYQPRSWTDAARVVGSALDQI